MNDIEDERPIWGSEFGSPEQYAEWLQSHYDMNYCPAKPTISPNIWKAMGYIVLFYALTISIGLIVWRLW